MLATCHDVLDDNVGFEQGGCPGRRGRADNLAIGRSPVPQGSGGRDGSFPQRSHRGRGEQASRSGGRTKGQGQSRAGRGLDGQIRLHLDVRPPLRLACSPRPLWLRRAKLPSLPPLPWGTGRLRPARSSAQRRRPARRPCSRPMSSSSTSSWAASRPPSPKPEGTTQGPAGQKPAGPFPRGEEDHAIQIQKQ